ncbi:MAG: phosphomannomutase/phosphoglucomutase [Halieaceae bacterium]
MLELKKKNKESGTESPQGISSAGNSLHRYWLITLLGILIPVLASFGYLLLVREMSLQDGQVQRASATYSRQQAANVQQLLHQIEQRLQMAATSPLALAAISSGKADDLALVEGAMLDYFPGVSSLRLIPIGKLGTAGMEGSNLGLRNHIEVDLLRRTSDGDETAPESYQFEGTWLTSLAEVVQHPRQARHRAVVLATLNNQMFTDVLAAPGTELGRSSLQQVYRKGSFTRADEIASAGNGGAEKFRSEASVNGGQWSVVFTPSAQLLSMEKVDSRPVIFILVGIVLVVLIALILFLVSFQRALSSDVERISAAADRKSSLEIGVPQLLSLARQLRLATLRHAAKLGAKAKAKTASSAASTAAPREEPSTGGDMLVEELEPEDTAPAEPETPSYGPDFPGHVFRAYDIRGLVESELDEDLVTAIGKALGSMAGEQEQQALIVGCDGRTSSPAMKNCLVKALLDSGRDVIDIGIVPTPVLYFATHTLSTRSGVMVTGSHNPGEYNGFKITLDGKPLAGEGLEKLRERVLSGKFSNGAGRLAKQDIRKDYLKAIVSDMALAAPLKVVVDAGNGAASELGPRLLEELGCEVVPLYCEIDGTFPNHHPDPSVDANLADLQALVKESGADFGVAFDGDGDRLAVISAEGNIIRNDKLLMLFAQDVVSRNPGADVVFDIKCSRHLTQLVSRFGGRPILWKTGHAFMREKVQETGALLGGEFSGHIFFGERWFGFDDGMYAAARLAEIISSSGIDLTSLMAEYPETESTPEIRLEVPDAQKFPLMDRIASQADFSPGKITDLDGIRVDYNDGWGLVRASNTIPALILRFEAHDADAMERIKQQFRDQISAVEPALELDF